jgi:NADPH:quinone reductase-like Zn-dependent oxidoreductase
MVGGISRGYWIGPLAGLMKAQGLSRFVSQNFVMFITRPRKEDLTIMQELVKIEKVRPVLDRRYSLSEVPEAIQYLEEGHVRGKVVINVEHGDET